MIPVRAGGIFSSTGEGGGSKCEFIRSYSFEENLQVPIAGRNKVTVGETLLVLMLSISLMVSSPQQLLFHYPSS